MPPQTLPSWLRPFAEWNPVSVLAASIRDLWGNPNPFAAEGFPAERPVLLTVARAVVLIAVFAPLGVRRYRSMSRWGRPSPVPLAPSPFDATHRAPAAGTPGYDASPPPPCPPPFRRD